MFVHHFLARIAGQMLFLSYPHGGHMTNSSQSIEHCVLM